MQTNLIWDSLFASPPSMLTPVINKAEQEKSSSGSGNFDSLPVYSSFAESGYDLVEQIGRGAFGTVWRAKKKLIEYAVKTFNTKRQEGRNGFARELAAQLFIDKNITTVDFCTRAAVCGVKAFIVQNPNQEVGAIVYPLVIAGDLGDLIENLHRKTNSKENLANRQQNSLGLTETIELGVDFLRNIGIMHRNNIAHRDIKPENVLVRAGKKNSVFIDFGSACFLSNAKGFDQELEKTLNKVEKQIGKIDRDISCIPIDTTLLYADPDLVESEPINDRTKDLEMGKCADVFAAAIVLFELYVEQRATEFITSKNPLDLIMWQPNTKLVAQMSSKDPVKQKTYQRIATLLDSMLEKKNSIDAYADQLENIGKLL